MNDPDLRAVDSGETGGTAGRRRESWRKQLCEWPPRGEAQPWFWEGLTLEFGENNGEQKERHINNGAGGRS